MPGSRAPTAGRVKRASQARTRPAQGPLRAMIAVRIHTLLQQEPPTPPHALPAHPTRLPPLAVHPIQIACATPATPALKAGRAPPACATNTKIRLVPRGARHATEAFARPRLAHTAFGRALLLPVLLKMQQSTKTSSIGCASTILTISRLTMPWVDLLVVLMSM